MPTLDVVNLMVWHQLKQCVPSGTRLTSVRRLPKAQLDFIVQQATKHGYAFPKPPTVADRSSWQDALALLRRKGYHVASPGKSNHQSGIAYDLSGPNLPAIEEGIRQAVKHGRVTLAHSPSALLQEVHNNCVHVEVAGAVLQNEQFTNIPHVA
jgi:hypothetical protein